LDEQTMYYGTLKKRDVHILLLNFPMTIATLILFMLLGTPPFWSTVATIWLGYRASRVPAKVLDSDDAKETKGIPYWTKVHILVTILFCLISATGVTLVALERANPIFWISMVFSGYNLFSLVYMLVIWKRVKIDPNTRPFKK